MSVGACAVVDIGLWKYVKVFSGHSAGQHPYYYIDICDSDWAAGTSYLFFNNSISLSIDGMICYISLDSWKNKSFECFLQEISSFK